MNNQTGQTAVDRLLCCREDSDKLVTLGCCEDSSIRRLTLLACSTMFPHVICTLTWLSIYQHTSFTPTCNTSASFFKTYLLLLLAVYSQDMALNFPKNFSESAVVSIFNFKKKKERRKKTFPHRYADVTCWDKARGPLDIKSRKIDRPRTGLIPSWL